MPHEEYHAVLWWAFVRTQPGHDGIDGGSHILPGRLGLDVGGLRELISQVAHHVMDLL